MTFFVPFDGSDLASAALRRATEFGAVLDQPVLAVTVIPRRDVDYAREHGWLDAGESWDEDRVVGRLREQVDSAAPAATFEYLTVDRYAGTGTIGKRLRRRARDCGATLVVVGSKNAGRMVASLSSVGRSVAADDNYDVLLVRNEGPAAVPSVREASPYDDQ